MSSDFSPSAFFHFRLLVDAPNSKLSTSSLAFFSQNADFPRKKKQFAFEPRCSFLSGALSDLSSPPLGADWEALMLTSVRPDQSFRVMCVQTERNKCVRSLSSRSLAIHTSLCKCLIHPSFDAPASSETEMSCGTYPRTFAKTYKQICRRLNICSLLWCS